MGSPWAVGHAHLGLAQLDLDRRDHDGLANHLLIALRLLGAAGDRWAVGIGLRLTAALAVERGLKEHGLVLLGAADAMDEAIGGRPAPRMSQMIGRLLERACPGTPVVVAASAPDP